jgi:hypothetical protein
MDSLKTSQIAIPIWPPHPHVILVSKKCVENRGQNYKTVHTYAEKQKYYVWIGETKGEDKAWKRAHPGVKVPRVRPQSALVMAAEVVAVLDPSNPEHCNLVKSCPFTAPWVCNLPKTKAWIVVGRVAQIAEEIAYKGKQGIHYVDAPRAADQFQAPNTVHELMPSEWTEAFKNVERPLKRRKC